MTKIKRELELIDGMIEVQLRHAKQCDGIANRTMADKQKGWDMERVELLRKMRAALAAPQQQPEPVVWRKTERMYHDYEGSAKDDNVGYLVTRYSDKPIAGWKPLYAAQPAPAVVPPAEPVAEVTERDGNAHFKCEVLEGVVPTVGTKLYAAPAAVPPKLWLWRNCVEGRPEYWAFDNPFPIHMDDGDPQTLGEPCGYAIFKPSRIGRTDVSEAEILRRIAAAGDKP